MYSKVRVGGSIAAVALLATLVHAPAQQNQGDGGESEIQRGFQIAPVPLNLAGKNRGLVGLGSYFVNGPMDCVGCHSPGQFQHGPP
jgi:hypothetical protein